MSNSDKRKLVFVAGLHGNEHMPVRALTEGKTPFIIGSPKAYEKRARFINYDLNEMFGLENKSYEAKRAAEILAGINKRDLVIDFHTTVAATPPFVIIVDKRMIPLAAKTGLKRVVLMKHNIKQGHALINYRDGISVEVGAHKSRASYQMTLQVVENLQIGGEHPIKLYEVYDKITKPGVYVNFQEHKDGFIPILAGETAYDFYGLKAREIAS